MKGDTELPEVFEVDRRPTKVHAKKECHVDVNHGRLMGTSAERETSQILKYFEVVYCSLNFECALTE